MRPILFFDIDSTLVENRFSRRAIGEVLEEIAIIASKEIRDLAREMGKINGERQQIDPDHPLTMDWRDIIRELAERYNSTPTRDLNTLWEAYANAEEVDVLDSVHSVLEELKSEGYRLVIATKGLWVYQEPVLRVTGLLPYFDDILTPDKTGYLKTSPAYFDSYRRGYPNARFIQIGDHYYDDVMCAKRNGFTAVMRAPIPALAEFSPTERPQHLKTHREYISTYPKEPTELLPDAVVLSLQELPELLKEL